MDGKCECLAVHHPLTLCEGYCGVAAGATPPLPISAAVAGARFVRRRLLPAHPPCLQSTTAPCRARESDVRQIRST